LKKAINISVIILIVFVVCMQTSAQVSPKHRSLLMNELSTASDDSTKIQLLDTIAYSFYWEDKYDSCYYYANEALILLEKLCKSKEAKNNEALKKQCIEFKAISLANLARGFKRQNRAAAVDSLYKAIELIKQTGNRLEEGRMYESIGVICEFTGKDKESLDAHLLALEAYKKVKDSNRIALQLTNVSVAHRGLGNYGDALEYLVESLNISRKLNDSTGMVEALLASGFTYMLVDKWEDALQAQNDALKIFINMNDSLGIARVYSDMGVTNMAAENFEIALEQHKKALAIRLQSNDSYYYYTYASFSYIGEIYEIMGNIEDAIRYYDAALEIVKRTGIKISVISTNLNLGSAYNKLGNQSVSLKYYKTALKLSHEMKDQTYETISLIKIAKIYLDRNQVEDALTCLRNAEKTAPVSNVTYLTQIYQNLAVAYASMGNYKDAYLNSLKYDQFKDSAILAENLEKITSLTNRLEFDNRKKLQDESNKKMMEIKQKEIARQKVVRNFSLFGAFVILVLAIIYFIRFVEKNKLNNALNKTISNLESTQAQLVQAEKMASLGELTAGVAHEIQNPLNFVKNFSEVNSELINELIEEIENGNLDEVKSISKDLADNEEKIHFHGKRADAIVKGMLQHSRATAGEKEPTDINALIAEYLRLAYHGLRAKDKSFNADFKTYFDKNLTKINVVPQDIGRVLLNLINNAFYAVYERSKKETDLYKPEVIVTTKKQQNAIEIIVKDNGKGIPEKIKDKIFQPFFTTKPTGEGTGLGLSLSYDIIKAHSGEVKVISNVGTGTEFIIILPGMNESQKQN